MPRKPGSCREITVSRMRYPLLAHYCTLSCVNYFFIARPPTLKHTTNRSHVCSITCCQLPRRSTVNYLQQLQWSPWKQGRLCGKNQPEALCIAACRGGSLGRRLEAACDRYEAEYEVEGGLSMRLRVAWV